MLTAESVARMTADVLTDAQRQQALPVLGPDVSWAMGTAVDSEGRWGWNGGTGTSAYVDPTRGTVGVLLTQRAMTGPLDARRLTSGPRWPLRPEPRGAADRR